MGKLKVKSIGCFLSIFSLSKVVAKELLGNVAPTYSEVELLNIPIFVLLYIGYHKKFVIIFTIINKGVPIEKKFI